MNLKKILLVLIALLVLGAIWLLIFGHILCIGCQGPDQSPRNNISNALNLVKNGGSQITQSSTLTNNESLSSKQFAADGFEEHSVVFAKDSSIPDDLFEINQNDGNFSQFTYLGDAKIKIKAAVYCEPTGATLQETIESSNISDTNVIGLCGADKYRPCCLVVIKRA
jgi:hypothetical protein